jgi:hypothetical protein
MNREVRFPNHAKTPAVVLANPVCRKCEAPREPEKRCKPCRAAYLKTYRQSHPEGRDTEALKLRVLPADASKIRLAAQATGMTISEYLVRLHRQQPLPPRPIGGWKTFDALERLRREVEASAKSARIPDASIGSLSGRIKDLFDTAPVNAMTHQDEINAALRDVHNLRSEILPVLSAIQTSSADSRDRIEEVLVAIMPRRARE